MPRPTSEVAASLLRVEKIFIILPEGLPGLRGVAWLIAVYLMQSDAALRKQNNLLAAIV